ncbi:hypothetical protein BURMUCF2_B0033 [Burkholderia multivorans CF2]|nr:hypothetical protein BURMUCF2_B0033 [Burkholderia multivorans CF2]
MAIARCSQGRFITSLRSGFVRIAVRVRALRKACAVRKVYACWRLCDA